MNDSGDPDQNYQNHPDPSANPQSEAMNEPVVQTARSEPTFISDNKAYAIAAQIFHPFLLDMVTFDELKRLRQVCRSWEIFVACSPRFLNATHRIGRDWHDAHTNPKNQIDSPVAARGFTSFELRGFPFYPYFRDLYCPGMSARLTSLALVRIKIICTRLTNLIAGCPLLKKLTLERLYYIKRSTCPYSHSLQPGSYEAPSGRLPGCGISTLIIKDDPRPISSKHLPECTLNTLGSLIQWLPQNHQVWRTRYKFLDPDVNPQLDFPSMKAIGFKSPDPDWDFLEDVQGEDFDPDPNQLITIGGPNLQQRLQEFTLTGIRFHGWNHTGELREWNQLLRIASNFTNLKILKLHLSYDVLIRFPQRNHAQAQAEQLNWNELFPRLEVLALSLSRYRMRSPRSEFLPTLPPTLRALSYRSKGIVSKDVLSQFLLRNGSETLTSLTLQTSKVKVDNETFQLLIQALPQLKVLRLRSRILMDEGVTGIGLQAPGQNLKELKKLHTLDLSGCKSLSDQCVLSAIGLMTQLTFLALSDTKISDVGLRFLSDNCLVLEEFLIFRTPNVTLNGINEFVKQRQTVKSIRISRNVKSQIGNQVLDPTWKNVVKYKRGRRDVFNNVDLD